MPGTITIDKSLTGRSQKSWVKATIDGVKGEKTKGETVEFQAEPGTRTLQLNLGGFRTNTITLEVGENGRHEVGIAPTRYEPLTRFAMLGIVPTLIMAAWPGSAFRLQSK